jgi:hypothetical protein
MTSAAEAARPIDMPQARPNEVGTAVDGVTSASSTLKVVRPGRENAKRIPGARSVISCLSQRVAGT